MVDFVMLSLLIIAFQLDVAIPTPTADAPVPMLAMHVRVMALPWYPLLPVSIGLSLVLTHVALLLQRASTAAEDPSVAAADDRRRLTALPSGARIGALLYDPSAENDAPPTYRVCQFSFSPPILSAEYFCGGRKGRHRGGLRIPSGESAERAPERAARALPLLVQVLVPLLLLVCLVGALYSAIALPAFTLRFEGLVGNLVTKPKKTFRLIELGTTLISASGPEASVYVAAMMAAIMFGFVMVVPLLWLVHLLPLWCWPLSRKRQRQLLVAVERLYAWSIIDVFTLTVVTGLHQLPQYAVFMLGDECKPIDPSLPYFADLIVGDSTCLDLVPNLEAGCYVLLLVTVVGVGCGLFVTHVASRAVSEGS